MVSFAELSDITKRQKRKECLETLRFYASLNFERSQKDIKEIKEAYDYLRRTI